MIAFKRSTIHAPPMHIVDRFGVPMNWQTNEFGALLTTEDETIFDSKQLLKPSPAAVFTTQAIGNALVEYDSQRSSTLLSVSSLGEATRQTRRSFNYQPAKRTKAEITFIDSALAGDTTAEIGLFCQRNGVFLRCTENGYSFVLRSDVSGAVVERVVDQVDWDDPLDGTGPSHLSIEPGTSKILFFGFAWLGVGSVVCGFRIGRDFVPACTFENIGGTAVYIRTPNAPVRWHLEGGFLGAGTLEAICCSVSSEGGHNPQGIPRGDFTEGVSVLAGQIKEIMSGRLVEGSHATLYPTVVEIESTGNTKGVIILGYNPTFATAGTWRDPRGENGTSHAELSASGRTVASFDDVGHILGVFRLAQKSTAAIDLGRQIALGRDIDGTPDVLTVFVANTGAVGDTVSMTVNWIELI